MRDQNSRNPQHLTLPLLSPGLDSLYPPQEVCDFATQACALNFSSLVVSLLSVPPLPLFSPHPTQVWGLSSGLQTLTWGSVGLELG